MSAGSPDADWVQQARRGDRSAFEHLTRRHGAAALALATAILGEGHRGLDVSQEAFLKAYTRLDQLRDAQRFRPWLLGIVRSTALDALRHARRRPADLVAPEVLAGSAAAAATSGPEDRAQAAEQSAQVQAALAALPDHYREVVALKYQEDLSYEEIASILGTTTGTVESRLFRARKELRRALATLVE